MPYLKLGVIKTSTKENEKRVPIHPDHIPQIPEKLRNNISFEKGYGEQFDISDQDLLKQGVKILDKDEILTNCDIAVLPKPEAIDLMQMKKGAVLWGWAHLVQQKDITQAAIDRKLTVITWECMNRWSNTGEWQMHIFYKNNELAGYCGVIHAHSVIGSTGHYGPEKKAAVINYGSVSHGAIYALQSLGIKDITVYTSQPDYLVKDQVLGINYKQFFKGQENKVYTHNANGKKILLAQDWHDKNIIVNGILQDTDNALMFIQKKDLNLLPKGCLIIDVSCDEGMAFPFARPTSFSEPMFRVDHVYYYAVDHTPSYLWNSASWEISHALLPFLEPVMNGPKAWKNNSIINKAIEMQNGTIVNPKILSFQSRAADYPHAVQK